MRTQATVDELIHRYTDARTLAEAEAALEVVAASRRADPVQVGDLFDELAGIAVEEDDYAAAVRLQRRAVELGCEYPRLAREMLAWYLLKDGQTVAGEAEFAALRREHGDDPQLLLTIGNARSDAGRERDALAAFDAALAAAKEGGEPSLIDEARAERRLTREELGLEHDEDDWATGPVRRVERTVYAVGWFPRDDRAAALERWPDLAGDLGDPDAYCRSVEERLRDMRLTTGQRPTVAPLKVERLVEFAAGEGMDAGDSEVRAKFAAELYRRGQTLPWPPGRNEACWCGSGRKYKRCCAQA